MRIGSGSLRGRRLMVAKGVRPTGGRTKEALLSRWQDSLPESVFLDLFAGSGAVGLEALSRGAREVVFVERSAKVLRCLAGNCEGLAAERCTLLRATLPRLPAALSMHRGFDHVFADPPYGFAAYPELLERIAEILLPGGEAAVEHSRRQPLASAAGALVMTTARDYGESRLSFYARPQEAADVEAS